MWFFFFFKCVKFYRDFKNEIKSCEMVYGFEDYCIWTCCRNFSEFRREYMWWGVNVSKHSPKNLDLTKRNFFQLNFLDIITKLGKNCCCAGLGSAQDPLTRWLTRGVLKQVLSDVQVATIFRGNNFQIN